MAGETTPLLEQPFGPERQQGLIEDNGEDQERLGKHESILDSIGDRLPYSNYISIDWLRDLVEESHRLRWLEARPGLRYKLLALVDQASGWLAAALIGGLTAVVAFLVDIAEATVSDWKRGYCQSRPWLNQANCCPTSLIETSTAEVQHGHCSDWKAWGSSFTGKFIVYGVLALGFALLSCSLTMLTKTSLPVADIKNPADNEISSTASGEQKTMYMAAGSGIPEIKTILSGFVIPSFLSPFVLLIKAMGAIFAVASGLCLGKEGPFAHISACVGWTVANWFPRSRVTGRARREVLAAACAAGLSVAFGAPIGGVLFAYEEVATYFPRRVLWRAFLCSLTAALVLKTLNPMGTGKLVLFETHYGSTAGIGDYAVFIFLGIAGGLFGGFFCRANFAWSRWYRKLPLIKGHPVFETGLVVLFTTLLQYPNPLTREGGDKLIRALLVDCRPSSSTTDSWVCEQESASEHTRYVAYLVYGTITKLVLTIVTFGIKVPSGVIIPALDAGALFGRLVGLILPSSSPPGIFAMVGAAAFLAGVTRMTVSLGVIMFELTGELDYVVPYMIAILIAKWVADAIGRESVYDLAQTVLGHPFLDPEHALSEVQRQPAQKAAVLIPPQRTMDEITVAVGADGCVSFAVLSEKLKQLQTRGLIDAGLVLVQANGLLLGYLSETELEFCMGSLSSVCSPDEQVRLVDDVNSTGQGVHKHVHDERARLMNTDISSFVDRTPLAICTESPLEYVVEMFGKLGLRYLILTEEFTGRVVGVILKKRLVAYLEKA